MAQTLTEFMDNLEASSKPGEFRPWAYYGKEEDSLTFYYKHQESYAKRLDNFVTLFLSFDGDELVGCQVKGVRRALQDGNLAVHIFKDKKLQLGLFFHALAFNMPDREPRNRLVELGQHAKGMEVEAEELLLAS